LFLALQDGSLSGVIFTGQVLSLIFSQLLGYGETAIGAGGERIGAPILSLNGWKQDEGKPLNGLALVQSFFSSFLMEMIQKCLPAVLIGP